MPDVSFDNLLIICVIAVLAPLSVGAVARLRIPAVVVEIVAGIVVGPTGFGWVAIDAPVQILSLIGLAFLLFLAGLEIDLMRLRGRAARRRMRRLRRNARARTGAAEQPPQSIGWTSEPLLIAIALSATSLGLVVPVLKDAGQGHSAVGQLAIASASVADFAAIVLLSFFFSTSGGGTGAKVVLLGAFAAVIGVTAWRSFAPDARCGWAICWSGCRTRLQRSGFDSLSSCSSHSSRWPRDSDWKASSARSSRAQSSDWSIATRARIRTCARSSTRSGSASSSRCSSSAAAFGSISPG